MIWTVGCILLVVLWETFHLAEAVCGTSQPRILYSRDYLLKFDQPANSRPPPDLIFPNIADTKWQYGTSGSSTNTRRRRTRKRGRRGGLREQARRPLSRVPLPSIILANMQSLRNKSDELQAHVRHQHEFKEACILALTETWLGETDSDAGIALDGFSAPFRMDRVTANTGKSRGGGRGKVETRQVKAWSEEATLALQGCLDCTLWEEFVNSSRDIDELTEVVSSRCSIKTAFCFAPSWRKFESSHKVADDKTCDHSIYHTARLSEALKFSGDFKKIGQSIRVLRSFLWCEPCGEHNTTVLQARPSHAMLLGLHLTPSLTDISFEATFCATASADAEAALS
ncbi:hypothetical protein N1851_033984 [Merluccius polli]|uniref:Uncharacterized protein n=1 Tax=Merluccius polli TaxID=89951 RepID=A0AA47M0D4_MERPO|nr:hypothetical protein N1851_033984 [Merluccius polli]